MHIWHFVYYNLNIVIAIPSSNTTSAVAATNEMDNALFHSAVASADRNIAVDDMMRSYQEDINSRGWKICGDTPADGNCLFWAVSYQLDRLNRPTMFTHIQLRRMVVDSINELSDVIHCSPSSLHDFVIYFVCLFCCCCMLALFCLLITLYSASILMVFLPFKWFCETYF